MTKTPEELTEDWKAGKLMQGWYFCKLKNGLIHHFEFNGNDFTDLTCHIPPVAKILAPCNYDEYKAMQAELAELKEKIKKREELIQCLGSNIDELDVKKSVLIIENNKLRGLLKECVKGVDIYYQQLSRINDCPRTTTAFWQIEGSKIGLRDLLTRINTALGESEEK